MAFGSFFKKLKEGVKDFADGFKHGWNKTKSVIEKIPVVGKIAGKIPKFDNSNNPVSQYFGNDGYTYFDDKGNVIPKDPQPSPPPPSTPAPPPKNPYNPSRPDDRKDM